MSFLERFRRRPGPPQITELHELAAGLKRSQEHASAAERHVAYAQARLEELRPDLREEVALEMRMRAAQEDLEHARVLDSLIERKKAAETRLRRPHDALQPAPPVPREVPAAAQTLAEAEQALATVRARIKTRDDELKARFGIS